MKHPVLRWLLPLLRYGLCGVALIYLYNAVTWDDHINLADGSKARLVEHSADGQKFVIERSGHQETVSLDQVKRVGPSKLPDVELGIRSVVTKADMTAAVIAILVFFPVPFIQSLRLVWMLAVQSVHLRLWDATKLSFAGNFFNFALPGTTGGDLIKAYYITHYTHHKTEAVTTVFLDRAIGLLGLMLLASVMIAYGWNTLPWDAAMRKSTVTALGLIWAGLAVGTILVFSARLRGMLRLSSLAARLPAGEHLIRIGRATVAMRQHKGLVIASLLNTVVLQGLVVFSAYLMARALHMEGSFELYFVCVPIGFLIAAILVWALPGMLVPLLGAHLPNRRELSDMEHADEDGASSESRSPDDGGDGTADPSQRAMAADGFAPAVRTAQ